MKTAWDTRLFAQGQKIVLAMGCLLWTSGFAMGQQAERPPEPSAGQQTARRPAELPVSQQSARRPAELPFLDAPSLLGSLFPDTWVHDFGTPGWPDGWSPYGMDPGSVPLRFDGIPFDDPVTGRPDFELLPFDKLGTLDRTGMTLGRAEGVEVRLTDYDAPRPLTELVYRSTATGLQQVSVVHAQQRARKGGGSHRFLFGYGGAGARGEYDGSRLRRKRQILISAQRNSPGLRLEVGTMFNRHRVGAQSGVVPFAGYTYESIYQRIGAEVGEETAKRQSSRNDAFFRAELPKTGTRLQAWWTLATLTYRLGTDTTAARTSRLGGQLQQQVRLAGLPLALDVTAFMDAYPERDGWMTTPKERYELHAYAGGNDTYGAARIQIQAGFSSVSLGVPGGLVTGPGYALDMEWERGAVRPFVRSRNTLREPSASDLYGFGSQVQPLDSATDGDTAFKGRSAVDEIGVSVRLGWLSLFGSVAATRLSDGVVRLIDASADTLQVVRYQGTRSRSSATVGLGIREFSRRGLYAWARATGSATEGDQPDLDARLAEAIPQTYGTATIGLRGILFQGDLNADLSVRARGWTEHRGLRFHPETGLLALPTLDSRPMEQSVALDIVGLAHIRAATITISLENVLSGSVQFPGNQLVPDYPYPERRLRFSVFWPILD